MTNPYYNQTGTPASGSFGASSPVRAEFAAIEAGFALLPPPTDYSSVNVTATGSTTPRNLATRAADVVNALDYGLSAAGTAASNTTAMNAALAAAWGDNATGIEAAVLYIPAGNYLLNWFNVTFPVTIRGDGMRATILTLASGNPFSLVNVSQQYEGSSEYPTNRVGSDVQIESLTLTSQSRTDGPGQGAACGVLWTVAGSNPEYGRLRLRDVCICNMPYCGFYTPGNAGFLDMTDCVVTNNNSHDVFLAYSYDSRFSNCDFGTCGGNCVNLYSTGTSKFFGCNMYDATLPVLNIYSDEAGAVYGDGCNEFYGCSIGGGHQSAIAYNNQNAQTSARFFGGQIGNSGISAPNTWPDVVVSSTANNCLSFHGTEFQPIHSLLSTNNSNLNFAFDGTGNFISGEVVLASALTTVCETPGQFLGSYSILGSTVPPVQNSPTTLGDSTNASTLPLLALNGLAAAHRALMWQSAGVDRIEMLLSDTESGSNTGSNFYLQTRDDSGAFIATAMEVTRATGAVTLGSSAKVVGGLVTDTLALGGTGDFAASNAYFSAGNWHYTTSDFAWYLHNDGSPSGMLALYVAPSGAANAVIGGVQAWAVSDTGGMTFPQPVTSAQGYSGVAGRGGAVSASVNNFYWTGAAMQLWVDTTNLGNLNYTSDERVKQRIVAAPAGALDRVMRWRPIEYEWANIGIYRADGVRRLGLSAQQMQEITPSAVEGDPGALQEDGTPQPLTMVLLPLIAELGAALQEAAARIAALEAREV